MYEGEITENLLLMNLVICILKWVIWKTRNYIKYNKSTYREAIVITNLKNELRSNIQMMIKNPVELVFVVYRQMRDFSVIFDEMMMSSALLETKTFSWIVILLDHICLSLIEMYTLITTRWRNKFNFPLFMNI